MTPSLKRLEELACVFHALFRALIHFMTRAHSFTGQIDNPGKCGICRFEIYRIK